MRNPSLRLSHVRLASFLLTCLFLCFNQGTMADPYPKNLGVDILNYSFRLTLWDETDEIFGVTTILLRFRKDGVNKLRLDLVERSADLKGKGMVVESIDEKGQDLKFTHSNRELLITLAHASQANTETQITIHYRGIPADGLRIGPTKHGDRSFFNENWPHRARHWLPTIDHPYEKATSEFIVTAPSHYQVISNGLLMEETNLDPKTKLTHWKQSVPVSSWLYVLGVAEFAVQYVGAFDGKSIQTWVYRQDRDAGFYDFAEPTEQTIRFFSDYVGPYVYEKIANVETPSVKGGMETSSAIFYGEELVDGKRSTRLRNIVIHELAHQWFGNAVTESNWDDAWLSEGFATYFTMVFIEQAYGHDEMVSQLLAARKVIYSYFVKDPSYKIVSDRSPELGPVTNAMTYQKGAWVLHMLRNLMGDVAFRTGIQDYYKRYVNGNASTLDFRQAMERASGKDLKSFFNQWLYQGGNISLKGFWKYDRAKKVVRISLEQVQPVEYQFDFSVELGIYKTGDPVPALSTHTISSKSIEILIPSDAKPEKILIDPRTILLADWDFKEGK